MKPGTRIEILNAPGIDNETGKIVRPRAENLPLPGPNWHIVRFDADGAKLCIHAEQIRTLA